MIAAAVAGLVLGVAGSGHCAAMCGPLAALAGGDGTPRPRWRRRLAYHGGRLSTYALLGVVAGSGGASLHGAGLGRALAIAAGLALIAQACLALIGRRAGEGRSGRRTRLLARAATTVRSRVAAQPAMLGALNGLLPCGLVYAALLAAAGSGGIGAALAAMVGFGIGTVPALIGVDLAAAAARAWPAVRRLAAPAALAVAGLMLVWRGLAPAHHPDAGVAAPPVASAPAAPAVRHRHP